MYVFYVCSVVVTVVCFFEQKQAPPPVHTLLFSCASSRYISSLLVLGACPSPRRLFFFLPRNQVGGIPPRDHGRRLRARRPSPFPRGGQGPEEPPGLPPDGRSRSPSVAGLLRTVRRRSAAAAEERLSTVVACGGRRGGCRCGRSCRGLSEAQAASGTQIVVPCRGISFVPCRRTSFWDGCREGVRSHLLCSQSVAHDYLFSLLLLLLLATA